jgi:hypothetical membrane protein
MKRSTDLETRLLLSCGILGPLLCVTVFLLEGVTRPGYNPWRNWVSELSLGEQGWMNIANLAVSGLLILGFALALQRAFPSGPASWWGPRLVALFGVSVLMAGVFVIDPNGRYPLDVQPAFTAHGIVHEIAGTSIFISSSAACFVVARRFAAAPGGRGWARYSRFTGWLILTAFVAGSILAALDFAGVFPGAPGGLFQRIALIGAFTWIALLAAQLLRSMYAEGISSPTPWSVREGGESSN